AAQRVVADGQVEVRADVDRDERIRGDERLPRHRVADAHHALGARGAHAFEALRAHRRLDQAVRAGRSPAPCAGASRFAVVVMETGRHGLINASGRPLRSRVVAEAGTAREVPGFVTRPGGLSAPEVADRTQRGLVNRADERTSRSLLEIARANILTRFNAILGTMFVLILVFGEAKDSLFGIVLVTNALLGIVQEWRAKKTLDRLAVLSAPRARVVRDD